MTTFLLVLHLIVTVAMVGAILLQRSEGGGLVSAANSFMSVRGSANFLTRLSAILASLFIILSLILAIIAGTGKKSRSIFDEEGTPPSAIPASQEGSPSGPTHPVNPPQEAAQPPAQRGVQQGVSVPEAPTATPPLTPETSALDPVHTQAPAPVAPPAVQDKKP